jgi:hypothetical protein
MAKKPDKKSVSTELAQAEERVAVIKAQIAQAMIQRNNLPKSASDEEKAAATARVERLQVQHHEAVQQVLAIKLAETTKLEREHKEKKQRHKQLRASRQSGVHPAPHEEPVTPPRRMSAHRPMDRAAEEAQMDAANEEDLFLERQRLKEEDRESAEEVARQRALVEKKRKKEQAAERRALEERKQKEAAAKAEAARLKAEKEELAKIRQQASLRRKEEAKAKKRQQRTEREARAHGARDAQSSGWFGKLLRHLQAFFGGRGS